MALDFPASPSTGATYTGPNGVVWIWDGVKWTVGTQSGAYLPLSGGTLTGPLTVTGRIMANGATGALTTIDQGNPANSFTWVANANVLFCNYNGAANIMTLSSTGAASFSAPLTVTTGLVGTTTNNNAAAGMVGEYLSSLVGFASRISIASGTQTNVTSLALTAGDWDVGGSVFFVPTGSCTTTEISVSTTSGVGPDPALKAVSGPNGGAGFGIAGVAPIQRMSLAAGATLYLVANITLSSGTCQACGLVWARRAR